MLVKFEQNRMVQKYTQFWALWQQQQQQQQQQQKPSFL